MFKFLHKSKITYFLLLFIRLNLYFSKSIIIPFEEFLIFSKNNNTLPENIIYDKNKFIEENLSIKYISMLKIGTPEKIIPSVFNIRQTSLYIAPNEDYKLISFNKTPNDYYYNPWKSNTFKNATINKNTFNYNQYHLINETIKLYNDIKLKNTEIIKDFQIYLRDNLNNVFSYLDISDKNNVFIINQLKEKRIINSSILFIHYTSDSKGYITIGEYPHIYDKEHYFKEQLILFNFETTNGKYYDILANKIYISWNDNDERIKKEKKINFQNVISFHHNLNLIIASEEYMNLVKDIFFDEYIKRNVCGSDIVPMLGRIYLIYTCNKVNELNLKNFPNLNFQFYESKYIFTLNYQDLFFELNNIYYFLVVCDYHIDENWKLGKPFLKKFQFVFDGTKKLAGYYDKNIKINNKKILISNKNKIIIIFILSNVILIPLLYYLVKRIYIRRKLNAKELDNYYEDIFNQKSSLNIEKKFSK